jgi:hypothetical protein
MDGNTQKIGIMRKRVTIINYGIICDVVYEIGGHPSTSWSWLNRLFTIWETISTKVVDGVPTDKWIRDTYGDVEIRKLV